MKIIHTADLHLGSPFSWLKDERKRNTRIGELLSSFNRLVSYARTEGIKVIILSGDVFDADFVPREQKESFLRIIMTNPGIDFLYLKGNHDKNSSEIKDIANFKTFEEDWKSYEYENVLISGLELNNNNLSKLNSLSLPSDKFNIVMLHGEAINHTHGVDNQFDIRSLANKNIDYLALGHIHKSIQGELDKRGYWVQPGCLEGRGFDECGPKGFYVINTERRDYKFVPSSQRVNYRLEVDLSNTKTEYEITNLIKKALTDNNVSRNDLVSVRLKGAIQYEIMESILESLKANFSYDYFYFEVKNETIYKMDLKDLRKEKNIKGEFIRLVEENVTDDEEQSEIIQLGLKFFQKEKK